MQRLIFLILLGFLFFDNKIFSQEIKIDGYSSESKTQTDNSGWRRVEETPKSNEEKEIPCWEKVISRGESVNIENCLIEFQKEKNRLERKKDPKVKDLKLYEKRLKKIEETQKKSYANMTKNNTRIENNQKKLNQAKTDANIYGCDSQEINNVYVNPKVVRRTMTRRMAIVQVFNNTDHYVDIIQVGGPVAIRNLCPGGSLDLYFTTDYFDWSYGNTFIITAVNGKNSYQRANFSVSVYDYSGYGWYGGYGWWTRIERQIWNIRF